jgi:prepilin-type N-terminal cleavage/methylation domain-containing protein
MGRSGTTFRMRGEFMGEWVDFRAIWWIMFSPDPYRLAIRPTNRPQEDHVMQRIPSKSVCFRPRRGFTLIELLVVIAIIAILAAILFPVFAQARQAAWKTVDISNFKQTGLSIPMYVSDFDGSFPMSNTGHNPRGWGFCTPDRVWGQLVLPYVKNIDVFRSPVDGQNRDSIILPDHASYCGRTVATLTPENRTYIQLVRSNMGYNYVFLSPWRQGPAVGWRNTSATIRESEVQQTSGLIMLASSIWYRHPGSGLPQGGGNWVIEAPCAIGPDGRWLRPTDQFARGTGDGSLWHYPDGWADPTPIPGVHSWLVYGGMWPWHTQRSLAHIQRGLVDGHVIVAFADGSVRAMYPRQTAVGCRPYGRLGGRVTNMDLYLWDLD